MFLKIYVKEGVPKSEELLPGSLLQMTDKELAELLKLKPNLRTHLLVKSVTPARYSPPRTSRVRSPAVAPVSEQEKESRSPEFDVFQDLAEETDSDLGEVVETEKKARKKKKRQ